MQRWEYLHVGFESDTNDLRTVVTVFFDGDSYVHENADQVMLRRDTLKDLGDQG